MKDQVLEVVQSVASGKAAVAISVTTASTPVWIDEVISSPEFQAGLIVLGALVSISILAINVQAFSQRLAVNKEKRRQEKIRTALLDHQAKEKDIRI